MTVVQVVSIEEVMKQFGILLEHENGRLPDGTRWTYFYADLTGLKDIMEDKEDDDL